MHVDVCTVLSNCQAKKHLAGHKNCNIQRYQVRQGTHFSRHAGCSSATGHQTYRTGMRERITFVHGAEDKFDPKQLTVEKNAVQVQNLKAAREDRLTFSFSELPQEVMDITLEYLLQMADYASYIVS